MNLADLRTHVDEALTLATRSAVERIAEGAPALAEPAGLLEHSLVGGKRLRPMLVLVGHQLVAGSWRPALGPALATELLHLCALLHDDVIDAAATRRGRPAFHVAQADRHRGQGWQGDADSYGIASAILFGDLAFVLADGAFFESAAPPGRLLAAHRVFTTMREEVMRGQFLDVDAAARASATPEDALRIALHKSGRYTVTRPLQVGATLGGAPDDVLEALREWADPIGVAFQLTDDLLGVFGDPQVTGKDPTSDLREGKQTLVIAEAMHRLAHGDSMRLASGLSDPDPSDTELEWMREALGSSGAREAVEGTIADHVARATASRARLSQLGLDAEGLALLDQIGTALVDRDR